MQDIGQKTLKFSALRVKARKEALRKNRNLVQCRSWAEKVGVTAACRRRSSRRRRQARRRNLLV
jgi:hypothetical protein